jgi:BirA family transcriptional regulator, biotin operon repressor / biotin---[acetyl-CoA-carboxylase] ligase
MIIGNKIYHKKKVYSSLEWAKQENSNAPDGALFLADIHEYTRGRLGRIWKFDPEQLTVTFILKPQISLDNLEFKLNHLNMAISLGILEPLKKFGTGLKWPNDFVISSKKICGVIFESVWKNKKLEGIVVGFGINANNIISESDDLFKTATSLKMVTGKDIDKKSLFASSLESLNKFYKIWLECDFDEIFSSWKNEQIYLNKKISVHKKDGTIASGLFKDLSKNGDLVLQISEKEEETIPFYIVENVVEK